MNTTELNGISINFEHRINPKASGATVVLVHGFGASLESWNDIIDSLSARHSVLRFDLRGHGRSAKPIDQAYSLADQAQILKSLISKLALGQVHLVGHSYGGGVVLMSYLSELGNNRTTTAVRSLVLIDSAGYRQDFPFFITAVEKPALQFLANLFPATIRARVLLTKIMKVQAQVSDERIHRYAKYFDLPGSSHAIGEAARALIPPDIDMWIAKYKEIAVPCQIIWGEEDPAIPVEMGYRFAQDIAASKISVLAHTGHIPHEERPDEVISILLKFFKSNR